ncbi:MAG: hypothetical protein GX482_06905 [Acholeplasmataceae bacterium]|jgi:hypothetical protein|nr:hypothetical protein [Acholeplasmataceae bacterium]
MKHWIEEMTAKARRIFEKYNPPAGVARAPRGRARLRKPLDNYAKAATNLYGIIKLDEFVEIFNCQIGEDTNPEEVKMLLLPWILEDGLYCFYKDYLVHSTFIDSDFDFVKPLARNQEGKPRYLPEKNLFLRHALPGYEDNHQYWWDVLEFMEKKFGTGDDVFSCSIELKMLHPERLTEVFPILNEYGLGFQNLEEANEFMRLLTVAKNNVRLWENKGYTPSELRKLAEKDAPKELHFVPLREILPDESCPCGSGKKYKHCCSISPARLPEKDRILFYDTWLRLLDYVNKKEKVCDYQVNFLNPAFNLQSKLCLIRDRLWEKPSFISEYTLLNPALTKEAAELLRAWEKKHVRGKFLLLEYRNGTAIMMQIKENETPKLYAVIGITSTISETVMSAPPVLLKTVLLPFGDRIIYDGFIVPYQISFGLGARKMFSEQYEMEKLKHGILTKL